MMPLFLDVINGDYTAAKTSETRKRTGAPFRWRLNLTADRSTIPRTTLPFPLATHPSSRMASPLPLAAHPSSRTAPPFPLAAYTCR